MVSLDRILAAYTIVGARANFQENETGSITVGKAADLIVLDHDLTAISPFEIHATHVLLTMLEGRVVFGDVNALRGR